MALLPIAAILVVGFTKLGPGTLLDLSLALFVGIAVGAYSSIFIATPLLVDLRRNEPALKELDRAVTKSSSRQGARTPVAAGVGAGSATPDEARDDEQDEAPRVVVEGEDRSEVRAEGSVREVHKWAQSSGPRQQPRRAPKSKR